MKNKAIIQFSAYIPGSFFVIIITDNTLIVLDDFAVDNKISYR